MTSSVRINSHFVLYSQNGGGAVSYVLLKQKQIIDTEINKSIVGFAH